jgi:hypothetical protein
MVVVFGSVPRRVSAVAITVDAVTIVSPAAVLWHLALDRVASLHSRVLPRVADPLLRSPTAKTARAGAL